MFNFISYFLSTDYSFMHFTSLHVFAATVSLAYLAMSRINFPTTICVYLLDILKQLNYGGNVLVVVSWRKLV